MKDMRPEVRVGNDRDWSKLSYEQRMRLGAEADAVALDAARRLAEKQSPGDPAALFLFLHGDQFEPSEREKIAAAFRSR